MQPASDADDEIQTPENAASDAQEGALVHVLQIAGFDLVIPSGRRTEVAQAGPVARLPFSDPWFEGLTNHRGNLIPVYDLHRFLFPDLGPGKGRYLVVFGDKEDSAAVRADELTTRMMKEEELQEPPADLKPPLPAVLLVRAFRYGDRTYFEPAIEPLLLALGNRRVHPPAGSIEPPAAGPIHEAD